MSRLCEVGVLCAIASARTTHLHSVAGRLGRAIGYFLPAHPIFISSVHTPPACLVGSCCLLDDHPLPLQWGHRSPFGMQRDDVRANAALPASSSSRQTLPSPSLQTLPPELLIPIFSCLKLNDLCALTLTSRPLHLLIDQYGWESWCCSPRAKRRQVLSLDRGLDGRGRAKAILEIDDTWEQARFQTRQVSYAELSAPLGSKVHPKQRRNHSIEASASSLLCLTATGLVLATKSCIAFWTAAQLRDITKSKPSVHRLAYDEQASSSGWDDITTLTTLARDDDRIIIVVGRFNGCLELWRLDTTPHGCTSVSRIGPAFGQRTSTVRKVAWLPHAGLLAAVYKKGEVEVYQASVDSAKVYQASVESAATPTTTPTTTPTITLLLSWRLENSVPWTCHLGQLPGQPPYLAIGCQGDQPLLIYKDICAKDTSIAPVPDQHYLDRSHVAVYDLASVSYRDPLQLPAFPPRYLYAGCFDGTLHAIDLVSQKVVQTHRDVYDDSPIYSILLGAGARSTSIAVGTARHGLVKVYEGDETARTSDASSANRNGWSVFPPPPSTSSPTYSVVGEHSRLFCAGADRLWVFDGRHNALSPGPKESTSGDQHAQEPKGQSSGDHQASGPKAESLPGNQHPSTSWYRHTEMIIRRTDEVENGDNDHNEGGRSPAGAPRSHTHHSRRRRWRG